MGWSFFAFDWIRFHEIRSALMAASMSGDFTKLDWAEAVDLLEHADESISARELCNSLVSATCGAGDPVHVEDGLPAMVLKLRRMPGGEEPGDVLAGLISAGIGIEEWFEVQDGLIGMLSPPAVEELNHLLHPFKTPESETRGIAGISRKLSPVEPARDPLQALIRLAEWSAEHGYGIGAFRG